MIYYKVIIMPAKLWTSCASTATFATFHAPSHLTPNCFVLIYYAKKGDVVSVRLFY